MSSVTLLAVDNYEALLTEIEPLYEQDKLDECIKLALAYKPADKEKDQLNRLLFTLHQERGETRFISGDVKGSVDDFEYVVKAVPDRKAHHWQLGISYYYTKQFKQGKALFELHKTVNPQDVENAVWHFICNAQVDGFKAAQKALIPIEHDGRIPMMDIYELFAGRMTLENFMNKMPDYKKVDSPRTTSIMYAHQYLGLYHEALGNAAKAKEHMLQAVKAYQEYKIEHYMGDTAVTHCKIRQWKTDK